MMWTKKIHKIFDIWSSKRSRFLVLASFFIFVGVFLVAKPSFAGFTDVVYGIVGGLVDFWVSLCGRLIALITYILIAIANYNNFSNSQAISTGWVIVRDIANMFFVVVFLVIAFGTILGLDQYHYRKTLPRLLIMAILINFSKTIAGLIIDFGQVIMMTFVNGFSQAAGGNFLEVLRIRELSSIRSAPGEADRTLSQWDAVGGLVLAAIVATVSLVVMTIMTMVLVMRIVMLWMLVVISPIAFFAAAVPSNKISGYHGQWWKEFTNYVIVGPVLAFFIWLSLAVISNVGSEAQSIADAQNVRGGVEGEVSSIASGIGSESNMIKYMIGLGMLVGGLIMTKQMGVAGSGMAGGAVAWGKSKGTRALKWAGSKAGRAALAPVRAAGGAVREQTDRLGGKVYGGLAKSGIPLVSGFAAKRAGQIRGRRQELEKKAGAFVRTLSLDEAIGYKKSLERLPVKSDEVKAKIAHADRKIIASSKFSNATDENRQLVQSSLKGLEKRARETGDDTYWSDINGFKQARPDMLVEKEREEILGGMTALDIAGKVGVKAFESKEFLESLRKNKQVWDSVYKSAGAAKKAGMDEYMSGLSENRENNPNIENDLAKRKTLIQGLSDDKLVKIKSEALTKENVTMMKPQQVEVMLKANKLTVDTIDTANLKTNNGELAARIATHGSPKFREEVQKKAGGEYLSALQTNRDATFRADPSGYAPQTLAVSKEILRVGGGTKASFNVNVDGGFKGGEDMVSFDNAIREEKGGDSTLALKLKPEEIKAEVAKTLREALYSENTLAKLAGAAKSNEEKAVLGKIIREIFQKAVVEQDKDMTQYIKNTPGLRDYVPRTGKS